MISLGVKGRAFILAFIPMLFITSLLSIYFINHILEDIDNEISNRGKSMAIDLANASEYGLFSGNIDSLRALLESSLAESDIISIKIIDKTGNLLLDIPSSSNLIIPDNKPNSSRIFNHSIILHTTPVSDILDEDISLRKEERPEVLGWVTVEMSTRHLQDERKQSIKDSFLIIATGIIISIFLALWISRSLTIPITNITNAVRDIEDGNLDVQINTNSTGEIGTLENGIQSMLGKVRLTQQDLEEKIDQATAGLNNSLKLLERQNTELTDARRDAMQANQAKSRFLANISHEIRTPMNGILGFVHLLLNSPVSKEQKEYLNTIEKSANNLLTLIEDILDLSRAEAGKLPLRYIFFNLQECVEDVIMLMTPSAQDKNLELAAIHYSDTPIYINAPYERVRQILINLVGNAIKFSENGTIVIRTMLDHEINDPNLIRISVSDQGIGISDDEKAQLFTPFTQIDDSSTRAHGGSGLGLAISKSLANAMGGDIGISNDSETGSTFWFTFYFQKEKEMNLIYNSMVIPGNRKVCLYDSNEFSNSAISSCFKHLDMNVNPFIDLKEFITELDNNKNYDICVLSLNQAEPESENIRIAIKQIKKTTKAKILAFIYNMESTSESFILNLGADACLSRPCLQNNLADTISRLLNLDLPKLSKVGAAGKSETVLNDSNKISSAALENLKILVAEDNPINTKLLLTVLKEHGADCVHANNGEEAINIYKENTINLVLMDKQMPGVSGFDATRRIREIEQNKLAVPIIGLTAATTPEELSEFMASGIDDILTKPITTDDLIHEILYWVDHYNNLRNIELKNSPHHEKKDPEELKSSNYSPNSLGINKELSSSLRELLMNELPSVASQLQDEYSQANWSSMREQLHKLLGGLSYCDLPDLFNKAKLLKSSIEKQSSTLDKDFDDLLTEIDNTLINGA